MTTENNLPNPDPAAESLSQPTFGQPILSESAAEALKAVIEIRAFETATRLKNSAFYNDSAIND